MFADQFTEASRNEHRAMRDALLSLMQAFRRHDMKTVRPLIEQVMNLAGPHFQYHEDALYRAMVPLFGADYLRAVMDDRDRVIGHMKRLAQLAGKQTLTEGEVAYAIHLVRKILPHISTCDGLSIMVECLPDQTIQSIMAARTRSLAENVDVLSWSEQLHHRPSILPTSCINSVGNPAEMPCTD